MSNLQRDGKLRWVPSYLRNRGKITRAQKNAMREHWPRFGLEFTHGEGLDLDSAFSGKGPLLIEIGFGMGDSLVEVGEARPDWRILGIEVHRPGLAAACGKLAAAGLKNVRIVRGDARLVLEDHLPAGCADLVLARYPEPWPKPGDAHRRLVQPDLAALLRRILVPGGCFLFETDWPDYAVHARAVFAESEDWLEEESSFPSDLTGPTRYLAKAEGEGRGPVRCVFRKCSC